MKRFQVDVRLVSWSQIHVDSTFNVIVNESDRKQVFLFGLVLIKRGHYQMNVWIKEWHKK